MIPQVRNIEANSGGYYVASIHSQTKKPVIHEDGCIAFPVGNVVTNSKIKTTAVVSASGSQDVFRKDLHVYENDGNVWTLKAVITSGPSPEVNVYSFGREVAISEDGNFIAALEDGGLFDGTVHVFKRLTLGEWIHIDQVFPNITCSENFGSQIVFSEDGSTLAIGSYERKGRCGFIHVYDLERIESPGEFPDMANGVTYKYNNVDVFHGQHDENTLLTANFTMNSAGTIIVTETDNGLPFVYHRLNKLEWIFNGALEIREQQTEGEFIEHGHFSYKVKFALGGNQLLVSSNERYFRRKLMRNNFDIRIYDLQEDGKKFYECNRIETDFTLEDVEKGGMYMSRDGETIAYLMHPTHISAMDPSKVMVFRRLDGRWSLYRKETYKDITVGEKSQYSFVFLCCMDVTYKFAGRTYTDNAIQLHEVGIKKRHEPQMVNLQIELLTNI